MKKAIQIWVLLTFCLALFTGCVKPGKSKFDLDEILLENEGQFSEEDIENDDSIFDAITQEFILDDVQKERTFFFNGEEHTLVYQESLYYPTFERLTHSYIVDGREEDNIVLCEDGSISGVYYAYTTLDMQSAHTEGDVLTMLKKELEKSFDISIYSKVDGPADPNKEATSGSYNYLLYNEIDGYRADWFRVSVNSEGGVVGILIYTLKAENVHLNIDEEKEYAAIAAKLKEFYGKRGLQYQSHEMHFPPRVMTLQGKLYIEYDLDILCLKNGQPSSLGYIQTMLVPVEMITASETPAAA